MRVCDMCQNQIEKNTEFILVLYGRNVNKNIDLCEICAKNIERFIEYHKEEE